MHIYITNCILWILALYGAIEILKNLIYIHNCNNLKTDGINLIVGVRNQEDTIEGFLRALNFRLLYGKENYIENILVLDLNSTDNTKHIIEKFSTDHSNVTFLNWKEFEELFSPYAK